MIHTSFVGILSFQRAGSVFTITKDCLGEFSVSYRNEGV